VRVCACAGNLRAHATARTHAPAGVSWRSPALFRYAH
jgi:hypothetical protein